MDVPTVMQSSRQVVHYRRVPVFFRSRIVWMTILWLFGLFSVFLSPAPMSVTPEMQQKFDNKMLEVEVLDDEMLSALNQYRLHQSNTSTSKVWFWRFRPEYRKIVKEKQIVEKESRRVYMEKTKRYNQGLAAAKKELGIWTDHGINESRHLFWKSYETGKVFAQRQSLADAFWVLISYPNTDALERFFAILMVLCANFTSGMISALFIFLIRLPSFISSFQPGWFSGFLFFGVAALGGMSVIASVLVLLYGSAAVFMISIAGPSLHRIENRRGPDYLHNYRSHQD